MEEIRDGDRTLKVKSCFLALGIKLSSLYKLGSIIIFKDLNSTLIFEFFLIVDAQNKDRSIFDGFIGNEGLTNWLGIQGVLNVAIVKRGAIL